MYRLLKDVVPTPKTHLKNLNQNTVKNKEDRTLSEFCNSCKKKFDVICLNFRAQCSDSIFLTIPHVTKIMGNKGIIYFTFSVGRKKQIDDIPLGSAQEVIDRVIAGAIIVHFKQNKIKARYSIPVYNYMKTRTPATTYAFLWEKAK